MTTVVLVAIVSIAVAAVTTLALHEYLFNRLDDQLRSAQDRARVATSYDNDGNLGPTGDFCGSDPGPGGPPIQGPGTLSGVLGGTGSVQVFGDDGCFSTLDDSDVAELSALPVDNQPRTVELDSLGEYRVVVFAVDGATAVTGLPTSDAQSVIERMLGWELVVTLLGVVLAAGAAILVVGRQLSPLRRVAATAQDVASIPLASGDVALDVRVPQDLTDVRTEVGQMGAALNLLLGHVESALSARHESEQNVRRFVADASHELRTPLATIRGYAELSRRTDNRADIELLTHAMAKVEVESARMATLVDDLLLLARLDAGRPLDRVQVDVARLVVEAVNDARVLSTDHQWRITLADEEMTLGGDEHRLHQMLSNLLNNARAHTGPGTTVHITAQPDVANDTIEITVTDDGPGLPAGLRGREFERFSRGDSSRTRSSGGAGLGLSIVAAIVHAHGGTASVSSEPGRTSFVIGLPRTHSPNTG